MSDEQIQRPMDDQSLPEALAAKEARLGELAEHVLGIAAQVVNAEEERASVFATLARNAAMNAELEAEKERLAAEVERLQSQLGESSRVEEAPPPEASRHLVFFPTGGGYVLLEREGAAPATGDVVDLSVHGGSPVASVTKIGGPPIPGVALRCAYVL